MVVALCLGGTSWEMHFTNLPEEASAAERDKLLGFKRIDQECQRACS